MNKPLQGLLMAATIIGTPACLCDSEYCRAGGGIAIGGGGGGAISAPSTPMAPPVNFNEAEDPYADYEKHGAVNQEDCLNMLKRFQEMGRRVRFVRAVRNPYNQGGGALEWLCLFDGEDASPEATPFEDDRFPKSDYDFP